MEVTTRKWLQCPNEPDPRLHLGSPRNMANLAVSATGWLDLKPSDLKITNKRNNVATSLSFNGFYVLMGKLEITKTEVFIYLQFHLWIFFKY